MICSLYYDMESQGFQYWHLLILSPFGFVMGIAVFFVVNDFMKNVWLRLYCKSGAIIFVLGWVWLGAWVLLGPYIQYRDVLNSIKADNVHTVFGEVSNFKPASHYGSRHESFVVAFKNFSYSPNDIKPGFRTTRDEGNPIRIGDFVRISYVGQTIVKIELCSRG